MDYFFTLGGFGKWVIVSYAIITFLAEYSVSGIMKSCMAKQQSGAAEACWAHNPEVRRSKLRSAKHYYFKLLKLLYLLHVWLLWVSLLEVVFPVTLN